ncbi:MAG: TIM barrel protein [Paracoccaceae bacterium]|nr:TIM barrel protein [Paracoccaceae bacterium]MDE2676049.1 TIM barrel protein [Paracoccaceae bacterium]MXZ50880.1 sugar phosphate isomerase/epimerase and 4-hydroxyphenylpyruvate domain-containing protein [Paracoccaceae bacterium]MYF46859.1 sugar phosphate isomerase/epimerase and 4-hydroxyphenylpyruvate domain-containing protein [Paracoccaceae bacterium]MYI90453.1 sugar phosphate isomerase/epimerase and 4-hydroxyphenylpyruvate domain-containing protein [Paracoccaceae bacterium]
MLSISTASIPGILGDKLIEIASAGFSGVELHEPDFTGFHTTSVELRKLVNDLNLKILLLKSFHDLEGWTGKRKTLAFDQLEHKFDLMEELDITMLSIEASSAVPDDDCNIVHDLAEAAERANKRGIRLAYMAVPWAGQIKSNDQALDLINEVDNPNLGLLLNSNLSLVDGIKPAQLNHLPSARIFHVQLSDTTRIGSIASRNDHANVLLPGQGNLNLAGFVKVIAHNGYKGAWSIAMFNENSPRPGNRTLARDGYRALVNLLDDVSRNNPDLNFEIPDLPPRVHASGFEFIEFAVDKDCASELTNLLSSSCFRLERHHITKSVELWRQGSVNIIVNTESKGYAHKAFEAHGPTVCDIGLRVDNASQTINRAGGLGTPRFSQPVGSGELDIPAIRGVGGNVVHFIDENSNLHRVWDIEFNPVANISAIQPAGIRRVDHVSQTMRYEEMQSWVLYYISTFEASKSPIFDVADPSGVVHSQAIESPEGEVRLNLNGVEGQHTFAASFLHDHYAAGVQHIAFLTDDIFETSKQLDDCGFRRLEISSNYYDHVQAHFGLEKGLVDRLKFGNILYDRQDKGEYFQIYSRPIFQGFFFEIVQRSGGYSGYGARNASVRLAAQKIHQKKPTNSIH